MSRSEATAELTRACDHLSDAHELLDEAEGLDEPERGAVLMLRTELASIIRRLSNAVVFADQSDRADRR